jgi:hypothetical protein
MSTAEAPARSLLRLAHAELGKAFEARPPFNPVKFRHPAPYGTPGGGMVQAYQAEFSYPGTVLIHHIHGCSLHDLVVASEPGQPDVLAVDLQADPDDPYTPSIRSALLRKAHKALSVECTRHIASRPLHLGLAPAVSTVLATFEWPGVVRVMTEDRSELLAVSLPGRPLWLNVHALRAAAGRSNP